MGIFHIKNRSKNGKPKAQAMVEFALIIPLLMLVLVGVIEFSRLMFAWIIIENSTRFGIRYATTGQYESAYCNGGGVYNVATYDLNGDGSLCSSDEEEDTAPRVFSIRDETRRIIVGFNLRDVTLGAAVNNTEDEYFNITVCSAEDGRIFIPPL
ncbi:MAG TPA: pilus assembly protein, partial [Aggregatilineales bacterium]|nr:pilus assembly protein [Aggregatilineales bacterium]